MDHDEIENEKIKSDPLSVIEFDNHLEDVLVGKQYKRIHKYVKINDVSKCVNLEKLSISTGIFILNPIPHPDNYMFFEYLHLNLTNCIHLKQLSLHHLSQYTFDNMDLTQCVQLTHLTINAREGVAIHKLDLTNCVNLTDFKYIGNKAILPNLTKCVKLESFYACDDTNYFELDLVYFPNMRKYNDDANIVNIHTRLVAQESMLSLIEIKFKKLEEENKELRKLLDEFRSPSSFYM
jgi:hypothetical protein